MKTVPSPDSHPARFRAKVAPVIGDRNYELSRGVLTAHALNTGWLVVERE